MAAVVREEENLPETYIILILVLMLQYIKRRKNCQNFIGQIFLKK